MWWLLLVQVYGSPVGIDGCSVFKCEDQAHTVPAGSCWVSETSEGTSTYYVSPCSDKTKPICPLPSPQGDVGACEPVPSQQVYVKPGEMCNSTSMVCINNGKCLKGICQGLAKGNECDRTEVCAPGLYCKDKEGTSTCQDQLTPKSSEECGTDFDCGNSYFCNSGKCTKYYSLSNGSKCNNNNQCAGAYCYTDGFCYTAPASIRDQPATCQATMAESDECESTSFKLYGSNETATLKASCECGFNSAGQPYCAFNPGDKKPKELTKIVKNWYNSSEINKCNSIGRMDQQCMKTYMDSGDYEAFSYFNTLISSPSYYFGLESCVKDAWFEEFYKDADDIDDLEPDDFDDGDDDSSDDFGLLLGAIIINAIL